MLDRYKQGERVTDSVDHGDLNALLMRYDATLLAGYKTKIGVGIEYFSKQHNGSERWPTDGFYVHRIDGTTESFSYIQAVLMKVKEYKL